MRKFILLTLGVALLAFVFWHLYGDLRRIDTIPVGEVTVTGLSGDWIADDGRRKNGDPYRPAVVNYRTGERFELPYNSSAQGLVEARGRLLVALPQANAVVDVRTGEKLFEVREANGLAFDPAGRLFVGSGQRIVVLDYPSGREIERLASPPWPDHLLWTPKGLLVATEGNDMAGVVHLLTDGRSWRLPSVKSIEGMDLVGGEFRVASDAGFYGVGRNEINRFRSPL